jgi:hypothetical protein
MAGIGETFQCALHLVEMLLAKVERVSLAPIRE